jgi:uncharacterized PurR-regulated membrane protein YhhQ (DUF165 family)
VNRSVGLAALAAFALTVLAANAALNHWGLVAVGFGLTAPAGVYFAGLAFQLRDIGQEHAGIVPVIGAILVGTALSMFVSPALALASGAAFLISESTDLAVYTPLRRRGWLKAVALSGLVGAVVDSVLFLWLAEDVLPGPTLTLRAVLGLTLGKLVVVAVSTLLAAPFRRQLAPSLA